ncbi:MAG: Hsp20/alpha crystallin family protein [Nitrococcus mobilis]|nr:Hsp20/alpha crystallin family protein [Nitrococcus mobilis]
MSTPRRNPFRGFFDVMSEMNRLQHQWMSHREAEPAEQIRTPATAWVPPADIFARRGDLVIRCELAGLTRADVDVTVANGMLTISGVRQRRPDEEDTTYYTQERFHGPFRRSMVLPEGIGKNNITAHFDNGLLEIVLKDGAAGTPQHIDIETRNEN